MLTETAPQDGIDHRCEEGECQDEVRHHGVEQVDEGKVVEGIGEGHAQTVDSVIYEGCAPHDRSPNQPATLGSRSRVSGNVNHGGTRTNGLQLLDLHTEFALGADCFQGDLDTTSTRPQQCAKPPASAHERAEGGEPHTAKKLPSPSFAFTVKGLTVQRKVGSSL